MLDTVTTGMSMADPGWPIPEVPELPESIFPKTILNLLLNRMSGMTPVIARTPLGNQLLMNLIRLSDKASSEYIAAKAACEDFRDNRHAGRLSPYFRAVDHFENSIGALHRALLHVDTIRSRQDLPGIERTAWRGLSEAVSRLNAIRDAVEHTEERLLLGQLSPQQSPHLILHADHLGIGSDNIKYTELGRWIRQVYDVMQSLANDFGGQRSSS